MSAILKALRAKRAAEQPKQEKPRYRVRNGKIVMRMYAVLAQPKPASNIAILLPREKGVHRPGASCPHCNGSGEYKWHTVARTEKCYRCNGKGHIDLRDLEFLTKRRTENRPVCHVVSA